MKQYSSVLEKCALFQNIYERNKESDITEMLKCLSENVMNVHKNQTILAEGELTQKVGIVLSGAVQVIREDYYGNRSIVASLETAQLFGEVFVCAGIDRIPVSVIAAKDSEIMMLDCKKIITTCNNMCQFHNQLVYNMVRILAGKNLMLNQKLEILSKRTTREKLMTYLLSQAKLHNSNSFTIPYDRQELADYLSVERSAMSTEIGKLRKEGILECKKNYFRLCKNI